MKTVLLSVLGAAVCAAAAGYGLLEAMSGPLTVTREVGGVEFKIELEQRLYEQMPVVGALVATGLVAALAGYAVARLAGASRGRRRSR